MSLGDDARKYVAANRERKADIMAKLAWASGIPSEALDRMDETQWRMLAAAAALVRNPKYATSRVPPPSDYTKRLTSAKLEALEDSRIAAA